MMYLKNWKLVTILMCVLAASANADSGGGSTGGGSRVDQMLAGSVLAKSKGSEFLNRLKDLEKPYLQQLEKRLPQFAKELKENFTVSEFVVSKISDNVKNNLGPDVTGLFIDSKLVAIQTKNAIYYDQSQLSEMELTEQGKLRLHERLQRFRLVTGNPESSELVSLLESDLYENGDVLPSEKVVQDAVAKRGFGHYDTPTDIKKSEKWYKLRKAAQKEFVQKIRDICTDFGVESVGVNTNILSFHNDQSRANQITSRLVEIYIKEKQALSDSFSSYQRDQVNFIGNAILAIMAKEFGLKSNYVYSDLKDVDSFSALWQNGYRPQLNHQDGYYVSIMMCYFVSSKSALRNDTELLLVDDLPDIAFPTYNPKSQDQPATTSAVINTSKDVKTQNSSSTSGSTTTYPQSAQ